MGGIAVVNSSRADRAFVALMYVLLTLAGIVCLFPLLYVISVSLTPITEVLRSGGFIIIPREVTFSAYKMFLGDARIPSAYKVTAFITIVGTVVNMVLTTLTAYPLSKPYLPGRKWLLLFFLFPMLFTAGVIPTYIIVKAAGLINSLWALILPMAITTYNMTLMRTFFSSMSEELFDASRIDGAGEMRTLLQIALPVSMPILTTITLFYGVSHWNEFFGAIMYITTSSKLPLQVVLKGILLGAEQMQDMAEYSVPTETLKMAAVVLTAAPIVVVYPFIQKYFTQGMLLGAVKG